MIITCSECHCSITINATECPLRVCPMCGHNFACTWAMSGTTVWPEKNIEENVKKIDHIMKSEEEKE